MSNESVELTSLRAESARLIALLESHDIDWRHDPAPTTPSASPPSEPSDFSTAEKVALFRCLFRGRADVYPVRWESATTGRAVAALLIALRFRGWRSLAVLKRPLIVVLHVGYAWVVAGLALKAVWLLADVAWSRNWVHAITIGAFGTMILGVTTRAVLGQHRAAARGGPVRLPRHTPWSRWPRCCGCSRRRSCPDTIASPSISAAIAAWLAGFVVYLAVYVPILLGSRADGRAG